MTTPFQFSIVAAPITTDLDPNSSAPAAARQWVIPPAHAYGDAGVALGFSLDDGTSVTIQMWELVHGAVWTALGSAFVVAADVKSPPIAVTLGGTYFAQITAVSGAPTQLYAGITIPTPGATTQTVSGTVAVTNAGITSIDGKVPSKGTAVMTGSTPVTVATNDTVMAAINTLITATNALITSGNALLTSMDLPSKFATVTPSDSTDLTTVATKGLLVTATGLLYVRGTGDAGITNLGTFQAGTFLPGKFMRVGVSTTATVIALGA